MRLEDVRRALVVGAGTMGPDIAMVYAIAGFEVDLHDSQPASLDRARERARSSLQNLADFGSVPAEDVGAIASRVNFTADLASVAPFADVVTEAIVEDPEAKRDLFIALDAMLRDNALLASNTSGLDVFTLLRDVVPARMPNLVIHHYFLPATVIPLVEVVGGPATLPATISLSVRLLEALGRTPVVLRKYRPNFIVNSFQVALGAVVAELLSEGVATPDEIDLAVKCSLGIRLPIVGVAQTLDFTGLELFARILRNAGRDAGYFEALIADGRTGARSGKGLYDYSDRGLSEIEGERDRKYLRNYLNLTNIDAFKPI